MVIQVDNQKEIMKELDMVGINKKYIYGDFDNTAQYINMKLDVYKRQVYKWSG